MEGRPELDDAQARRHERHEACRLGGNAELGVFTIVNVAVLVFRRRPVAHRHFRAPTWAPILGMLVCGYLATPLSGRPPQQFLIAGILLAAGVALWLVNLALVRRASANASKK